jgi:hypothetical protein
LGNETGEKGIIQREGKRAYREGRNIPTEGGNRGEGNNLQ